MHATSAAKSEKTMTEALEEASDEKVERFKGGVQHEEAGNQRGGGANQLRPPQRRLETSQLR
jgi:hypothetical protein